MDFVNWEFSIKLGAKIMRTKTYILAVVAVVVVAMTYFTLETMAKGRGHGDLGVVYVSSQGLYYDTFVPVETLPYKGRFQKLEDGVTDFGPGDVGYLGGRWWVDDGDDIMEPPDESGDVYLLCPLLPPGRTIP
jgi:hypothetical protein